MNLAKDTKATKGGKRTIMAYGGSYFTKRISYFSDDRPYGRYRLGDAKNNNADQITKAAPILAEVGDESCVHKCGSNVKCESSG